MSETVVKPERRQDRHHPQRNGDILKRSQILPDGREIILASDETIAMMTSFEWRDPGDDLPPLRLTIPIRDYILDADDADEDEIEFFRAAAGREGHAHLLDRRGQAVRPYS